MPQLGRPKARGRRGERRNQLGSKVKVDQGTNGMTYVESLDSVKRVNHAEHVDGEFGDDRSRGESET